MRSLRRYRPLPHEVVAGGASLTSCLLLWIIHRVHPIPDAARLVGRLISNVTNLALAQFGACLALSVTVILLGYIPWFRDRLIVKKPMDVLRTCLRIAVALMLVVVLHQSIPLWQHAIGWPDRDALLIQADETLFGGVNPVLWLERITVPWLTAYLRTAYLAWFVAFQGTMYILAVTRKRSEWQDMVLGTMMTLVLGYIGYVLVPAVGPVHALKAQFTVALSGDSVGAMTSSIVDQFGVWRDAFPSIHAAVSALLILYAWRYLRRWFPLYLLLGVSILFSTVYLRWHYVVDVLAGFGLALFCHWLAPKVLAWWGDFEPVSSYPPVHQPVVLSQT